MLIKLTAGMLAVGAIAGFLVVRLKLRRVILAAVVPAVVFGLGCSVTVPNWQAFGKYLRASLEITSGYSSAMSLTGDPIQFAAVAEILIWLGVLLSFVRRADRPISRIVQVGH